MSPRDVPTVHGYLPLVKGIYLTTPSLGRLSRYSKTSHLSSQKVLFSDKCPIFSSHGSYTEPHCCCCCCSLRNLPSNHRFESIIPSRLHPGCSMMCSSFQFLVIYPSIARYRPGSPHFCTACTLEASIVAVVIGATYCASIWTLGRTLLGLWSIYFPFFGRVVADTGVRT